MMVATIRKITVSAAKNAKLDKRQIADIIKYYVGNTSVGYYTKGGEPPGKWFGKGAHHLGLSGEVSADQLKNLLSGLSPDGSRQLVQIQTNRGPSDDSAPLNQDLTDETPLVVQTPEVSTANQADSDSVGPASLPSKKRDEHVCGFDVTFSAPKSVSVLWALSPPDVRSKIELAMQKAVEETLRFIERELPLVRRGKGGQEWETGNIIAALFEHVFARNENDPALHTHSLITNTIVANDGRTFKLNSRVLYPWIRTAGPIFRNNLAAWTVDLLGVELELAKGKLGKEEGWFEIKGIQKELIKLFSTRSSELLNEVELLGTRHSDVKAKDSAALRTRRSKGEELPREKLFEKWHAQAIGIGIKPESLQSLLGKSKTIDPEPRLKRAFKEATEKLITSNSTFHRRDLIREVSERMQDIPIKGDLLVRGIDHLVEQSQEIKYLGRRDGEKCFTTKQMWKLEQENMEMINTLTFTPGLAVSEKSKEKALKSNPKLSQEQLDVFRETVSRPGSLAVIGGVAGSGKSTVMKAIVEAYEQEGMRVLGVSLSGAAAQNLQEKTGAECTTIARTLFHQEKSTSQKFTEAATEVGKTVVDAVRYKTNRKTKAVPFMDENTVVVIDEVGMVDTPIGHRLLKQVIKAGAKVIAVGDHEQLPPIGAGNILSQMSENVAQSFLKKNWRQTEIEAEASQLFRDGEIGKALQIYAEKGDLHVLENRNKAAREMVKDWSNDGHKKSPETANIFVQTREEVRIINRMCQQERLLSGDMSSRNKKVGSEKIHEGEWVKFTASDRRKGIENSNTGVVTKIAMNGDIHVKLDREFTKEEMRRGLKKEIVITAKDLKKHKGPDGLIMPAYARTVHAGQGLSVDHAYFMPGGSMTNKNLSYVGISRSKACTKIYIDRDHAGPHLSLIEEAMKKYIEKATAHEISSRLTIERK